MDTQNQNLPPWSEAAPLNLWRSQWRDELISKARSERDKSARSYAALTMKDTHYAKSQAMVVRAREAVLSALLAMPEDLDGYAALASPASPAPLTIGDFTVSRLNDGSFWIGLRDGEGGQFSEDALAGAIADFYYQRF